MKKILLAISSLFLLVGCSTTYYVWVDRSGVEINKETLDENTCKEYSDSFFGGDFPLKIEIVGKEAEEVDAGNYIIDSNGVIKQDTDDKDKVCSSPVAPATPKKADPSATPKKADASATPKKADASEENNNVIDSHSLEEVNTSVGQATGGLDPATEQEKDLRGNEQIASP